MQTFLELIYSAKFNRLMLKKRKQLCIYKIKVKHIPKQYNRQKKMASIRRMCWFYIIISLGSALRKKMTFEIERRLNNGDTIPNDFIINNQGDWEKLHGCAQNNCNTGFNTQVDRSAKGCRCACKYATSTFRMGATALNSSCIGNNKLRTDEGCTILFQNEGTMTNALTVIDTKKNGNQRLAIPQKYNCTTNGFALYWDYGVWKSSMEDIFSVHSPSPWNRYLQWIKNTKYSGRIVKLSLTCTTISTSLTSRNCMIFKIAGKLSYDLNRSPTKAPTLTTSSTRSVGTVKTQRTQHSSTTKKPTTKPLTSTTTTYQTTPKLKTEQSTTSRSPTTLSPHTTHKTVEASTITDQRTTTKTIKHSIVKSAMTATEVTEHSTTEMGVVPGKKGARGASKDSDGGDDTIVIAAISAAAAITCVIIICIFLWFGMKRKQNNRNNEAYSTDMTVITNGTGMNNSSSVPSLKNPIYCEPTVKHHPKQLPVLGNPMYDKAIVNNHKGHQNIKKPSHKPKTNNDSNLYDNKDDNEAYDNPGYQDLVVKQVMNAPVNNADYNVATYAEPEKPVYEALSANGGRDSIYQPLVHNTQSTETTDPPEYLTLLDGDTKPEEQEVPEYLALVGDESSQTQPEYDYAFVDGQERRATLKAPSTRGTGTSQQDPQRYDGPSNNGPPVYDVLEDPSDQGPPLYDVLEYPNEKEPPVYDVLEGPDSGDDYLMPVEGN